MKTLYITFADGHKEWMRIDSWHADESVLHTSYTRYYGGKAEENHYPLANIQTWRVE